MSEHRHEGPCGTHCGRGVKVTHVAENWQSAIVAERERCAKILSDYADARAYDPEEHDDLMEVVARIRSGE